MPPPDCLIVDDIDATLAAVTELGHQVLNDVTQEVRAATLSFAARRRWPVISHEAFAAWAHEQMLKHDNLSWASLDPVFHGPADRLLAVRMTRQFGIQETLVEAAVPGSAIPRHPRAFGIVDDVASTGRTLLRATALMSQRQSALGSVLVCCATAEAYGRIRAVAPQVQWQAFVPGHFRTMHLRDGCPHLPFGGRPSRQVVTTGDDGSHVELRVPSKDVNGSLWQVLWLDQAVRSSIEYARSAVANRLSAHLSRPACVRDLLLLGPMVPAMVGPAESATNDTELQSLLRY